jgi:hypothetical protein
MLRIFRKSLPLALFFWFIHTLISCFFLICEIEVTYGVASDFGGATTSGQKTGQLLFRMLGFPFLALLWDEPYFEGPRVWWLVIANSAVCTLAICAVICFIASRNSSRNTADTIPLT